MNKIKLSESQKRVILLMREHGYDLVYNKEYFFWRFEKHGRDVMKNIASITARALVSKPNILKMREGVPNKYAVYELDTMGKTIEL
jgi:hypothetical protein